VCAYTPTSTPTPTTTRTRTHTHTHYTPPPALLTSYLQCDRSIPARAVGLRGAFSPHTSAYVSIRQRTSTCIIASAAGLKGAFFAAIVGFDDNASSSSAGLTPASTSLLSEAHQMRQYVYLCTSTSVKTSQHVVDAFFCFVSFHIKKLKKKEKVAYQDDAACRLTLSSALSAPELRATSVANLCSFR
jgi:hypothetical protein